VENCVKAILYTYPKLKNFEKDYEEHIENKAILSYRYKGATENVVEYIAEEILRKRRLAMLKETLDKIFSKLTEEEKTLLAIRYFGKIRKAKTPKEQKDFSESKGTGANFQWSERSYYRKQNRLLKKLVAEFCRVGLTKERIEKEYLCFEFLKAVHRFLSVSGKRIVAPRERALVRFLQNK
jgi:hypothetical protein